MWLAPTHTAPRLPHARSHQPSLEIFEAFSELLLLKRGGEVIFAGPVGHDASHLISYFSAIE